VAGLATDAVGVGPTLGIGSVLLAVMTYVLYAVAGNAPGWVLPVYALTGFTVGTVGVVPTILVRSFPPAVRFSGISAAYNIAYAAFGGLTPVIITLLLQQGVTDAPPLYVGALCLLGVTLAATGRHRVEVARQVERAVAAVAD
jgi:hypothetical protein